MTYIPYAQLTSTGVSDSRTNNTGVSISKATPVRINTSGDLDFVNVSVESEILNVVGVTNADIANGSEGDFINTGKIEDISTSLGFGDVAYISKTGTLTNVQPSIGVGGFVAGDFVVRIGVIAKNQLNPLLKDLILSMDIRGQL